MKSADARLHGTGMFQTTSNKLRDLKFEERYSIDPDEDHPLQKYVAWSAKEGIEKHGRKKQQIVEVSRASTLYKGH